MSDAPIQLNALTYASLIRGEAIGEYAEFERTFCLLFAKLMRTDAQTAGIVFYRIVNTRSRNTIIEKLLVLQFKSKYEKYWKSLVKRIRVMDSRRNEIVHWRPSFLVPNGQTPNEGFVALVPPETWGEVSSKIEISEIKQFISDCRLNSHATALLCREIDFETVQGIHRQYEPWHDIFAQPIPDPIPDSHPLSPNYAGPQNQPQSSRP